jgi:hypothetical protein
MFEVLVSGVRYFTPVSTANGYVCEGATRARAGPYVSDVRSVSIRYSPCCVAKPCALERKSRTQPLAPLSLSCAVLAPKNNIASTIDKTKVE